MDWITIVLEMAIKVFEEWWTPAIHRPNQKAYGSRRSIVRLIGSMLPLAQAKRVQLDLAVWKYDNEYGVVNDANSVSSLSGSIDEGHGSVSTDADRLAANSDMKKLLDEILELKTKMNEILQKQNMNICCRQSSCCSIGSTHGLKETPNNLPPSPPPPPPPPPPPMPLNLPEHSTPKTIGKQVSQSNRGRSLKPAGLTAVLDELKSSKLTLKHVSRSPGGRPLKDSGSESGTPRNDSGGDMLAEILRRRYIKTELSGSSVPSVDLGPS